MDESHDRMGSTSVPLPDPEAARAMLHDPRIRELLADAIEEELEARREPSTWKRVQPWVAGVASASVTVLAFFLPSLQEQWDRLQSRRIVQRYVELGRGFMDDGRYRLAEEAFARAFDLSESRRLDVEELRLKARIAQVDVDPEWGKPVTGTLAESDFLYLLQMQARRPGERAATLNSYAVFLAGAHRWDEAEQALRQSIALDSTRAPTWVHLGNLLSDRGRAREAEAAYRHAVARDSTLAEARYDLGLLLLAGGRAAAAESAFAKAAALAPDDPDALRERIEALRALKREREAAALEPRLRALEREAPPRTRDVAPPTTTEGGG